MKRFKITSLRAIIGMNVYTIAFICQKSTRFKFLLLFAEMEIGQKALLTEKATICFDGVSDILLFLTSDKAKEMFSLDKVTRLLGVLVTLL